MNEHNNMFIMLLKTHTNIDHKFIDTFLKKFKIGGELNFEIKDIDVCKYLDISQINLRKRLQNRYSKTNFYKENVDYVKIKVHKTSSILYMLNYECFERISLSGDTLQSEIVRSYFIELRKFITDNNKLIYQAIENKNDLSKYRGFESIYFFAVSDRHKNLFKVGHTQDIVNRLRNYNVGRIPSIDLKYFALVKNRLLIEHCIGLKLNKQRIQPNVEIFNINSTKLKAIIDKCYCLHVSKEENEELYKEVADLLGFYAYTKNKLTIKPYVIIR